MSPPKERKQHMYWSPTFAVELLLISWGLESVDSVRSGRLRNFTDVRNLGSTLREGTRLKDTHFFWANTPEFSPSEPSFLQ